jgi:hypothetical protein
MGNYRIIVDAVGGHGCERNVLDGQSTIGCQQRNCPDCTTREYVRRMKSIGGNNVNSALLVHWPETDSQVIDDLLTGERIGDFSGSVKTEVVSKDGYAHKGARVPLE